MSEQMRAAILAGIKQVHVDQVPMPEATPGALLLKILACGVCGSDIRIFNSGNSRVTYPAIVGHEIAAEIVEVGAGVEKFHVGELVSLAADVPCGECDWCQNGMGNCCEQNFAIGHQFPGGFAEYCLLNERVVRYGPISHIPPGVDVEQAALAEPLACCINGLERVGFAPGKSVLIIGAGPIGIMLALLARAFGAPLVILCDLDGQRLQMARVADADHYIDTASNDLIESIQTITAGRGADIVFTACPSPQAQEDALDVTATRGVINFFGGLPGEARSIHLNSNRIHYKEITLTGSHGSTPRQHAMAVDLIAAQRVDLSALITHRFPLEAIEQAFDAVQSRVGLKVLILPHA